MEHIDSFTAIGNPGSAFLCCTADDAASDPHVLRRLHIGMPLTQIRPISSSRHMCSSLTHGQAGCGRTLLCWWLWHVGPHTGMRRGMPARTALAYILALAPSRSPLFFAHLSCYPANPPAGLAQHPRRSMHLRQPLAMASLHIAAVFPPRSPLACATSPPSSPRSSPARGLGRAVRIQWASQAHVTTDGGGRRISVAGRAAGARVVRLPSPRSPLLSCGGSLWPLRYSLDGNGGSWAATCVFRTARSAPPAELWSSCKAGRRGVPHRSNPSPSTPPSRPLCPRVRLVDIQMDRGRGAPRGVLPADSALGLASTLALVALSVRSRKWRGRWRRRWRRRWKRRWRRSCRGCLPQQRAHEHQGRDAASRRYRCSPAEARRQRTSERPRLREGRERSPRGHDDLACCSACSY